MFQNEVVNLIVLGRKSSWNYVSLHISCWISFLSALLSGNATKPRSAVTAATWCAAAVATTRTRRSWWSAATASTTGAATSPARSASGSWRDTSANESVPPQPCQQSSTCTLSHLRLQINQSTTVPRRLNLVLSFSMCISRRSGLFLCQYHFLYQISKLPVGLLTFFFLLHKPGCGERGISISRFSWRPPSSWVFSFSC